MSSLYKKIINGKPYFYLREMARVDGKPKMVSERYLGSAADIVKAMDAAEAGMVPERTRGCGQLLALGVSVCSGGPAVMSF